MAKYLVASGHDPAKAIRLYVWNMQISEAFYPLLGVAEVSLRNGIVSRLSEEFGEVWWENPAFHDLIGTRGKGIVLKARNFRQQRKGFVTSGCMAAELTFGFWAKMLLPKYEAPLWSPLTRYLPHLPDPVTYEVLAERAQSVCDFRNRVFHHEPVFDRDISREYSEALAFVRWISPEKAEWIRPYLRVMSVLRTKP